MHDLPAQPRRRKAISKTKRFEIFKRDGFVCQYCGATPPKAVLHVEHIVAVANGGTNDDGNLTTACSICNAGKGVRDLKRVPESLAARAERVAEQEAQLRAYSEIMADQRARVIRDSWAIHDILYPGDEYIAASAAQTYKMFLKRAPLHVLQEAAEVARARGFFDAKLFRYFCGVVWNMLRESENGER